MATTTALNCLIAALCVSLFPLWNVPCQLTDSKASLEPLDILASREVSEENESVSENEELVKAKFQAHPLVEEAFDGK